MDYIVRTATVDDVDKLALLEKLCFPEAEAATREIFARRLEIYSDYFIVVENGDDIIGAVNGLVTDHENLSDEMYTDTDYHNENGKWQMIFGVETHPEYQGLGIASMALQHFIDLATKQGRKGLVLTCKENLIGFYETFGFKNEGISASEHGGVMWYQMRLIL